MFLARFFHFRLKNNLNQKFFTESSIVRVQYYWRFLLEKQFYDNFDTKISIRYFLKITTRKKSKIISTRKTLKKYIFYYPAVIGSLGAQSKKGEKKAKPKKGQGSLGVWALWELKFSQGENKVWNKKKEPCHLSLISRTRTLEPTLQEKTHKPKIPSSLTLMNKIKKFRISNNWTKLRNLNYCKSLK